MTIENNQKQTLIQIEAALKEQLPDYTYQIINNVVLVSKTESVQINVVVEDETVQVVEAVGFIPKLATALGVVGVAFYVLQTMELPQWIEFATYFVAFLLGGALGDILHKARYRKEYADFKPNVERVLKTIL